MSSADTATIADADAVAALQRIWWLPFVAGIASLAVGILMLAYPDKTLSVLALAFGIWLFVAGALDIVAALLTGQAQTSERVFAGLLGALALIAGAIVIRKPGGTLTVVALALGIYFLVAGALGLVRSFGLPDHRLLRLLVSLVALVAGIIVVSDPSIGIVALAVIIAINLILRGILEVALGLSLRRAEV